MKEIYSSLFTVTTSIFFLQPMVIKSEPWGFTKAERDYYNTRANEASKLDAQDAYRKPRVEIGSSEIMKAVEDFKANKYASGGVANQSNVISDPKNGIDVDRLENPKVYIEVENGEGHQVPYTHQVYARNNYGIGALQDSPIGKDFLKKYEESASMARAKGIDNPVVRAVDIISSKVDPENQKIILLFNPQSGNVRIVSAGPIGENSAPVRQEAKQEAPSQVKNPTNPITPIVQGEQVTYEIPKPVGILMPVYRDYPGSVPTEVKFALSLPNTAGAPIIIPGRLEAHNGSTSFQINLNNLRTALGSNNNGFQNNQHIIRVYDVWNNELYKFQAKLPKI